MINKLFSIFNKKNNYWVFLIILFAFSALMVSFKYPLYAGHDIHFHLIRLQALMDALADGQYISYLDNKAIEGYGYMTKVFYSDVLLLPFAIIGNLTNATVAYFTIIFTMNIICGIFMYWCLIRFYQCSFAAIMGSILYTFCIYRIQDCYQRDALGEFMAFSFLPIIALGLFYIIKGDYMRKWYIIAIGVSLTMFAHLISSVIACISICVFVIIYNKSLRQEPKRIIYLCFAALLTILFTAYYLFPMLEQMISYDFYYNGKSIFSPEPQYMGQSILFIMRGLFGGGTQHRQGFVPIIGILLTAIVCTRLFIYNYNKKIRLADVITLVGIGYLFVVSKLYPWAIFPFSLLSFMQFSWRLYEFISLFFAIAGGYYLSQALIGKKRKVIASILILITSAFFILNERGSHHLTSAPNLINLESSLDNRYLLGGCEYIPYKVPSLEYISERGANTFLTKYSDTRITNHEKKQGVTSFQIDTNKDEEVELPLFFYKGYTAYSVDEDKKIKIYESPNGFIQLNIDKPSNIKIYYAGTTTQYISFWISIISIVGFSIFALRYRRKSPVCEFNTEKK